MRVVDPASAGDSHNRRLNLLGVDQGECIFYKQPSQVTSVASVNSFLFLCVFLLLELNSIRGMPGFCNRLVKLRESNQVTGIGCWEFASGGKSVRNGLGGRHGGERGL